MNYFHRIKSILNALPFSRQNIDQWVFYALFRSCYPVRRVVLRMKGDTFDLESDQNVTETFYAKRDLVKVSTLLEASPSNSS